MPKTLFELRYNRSLPDGRIRRPADHPMEGYVTVVQFEADDAQAAVINTDPDARRQLVFTFHVAYRSTGVLAPEQTIVNDPALQQIVPILTHAARQLAESDLLKNDGGTQPPV